MSVPRELLEDIVRALKGRRLPDGSWLVHCPAHDDQNPSLHITPVSDRLLFHCFAGCSYEQVKAALEKLGLYHEGFVAIAKAIYVYEDEFGNPLYRKIRFEPKTFRLERLEGKVWRPGIEGVRRVLYRLPEVKNAQEVWIVEGEKDVETLRKFGVVATTNPNGASEIITEAYTEPLAGKDIVIIPDQDEPGKRHAAAWVEALRLLARSIKIVDLPAKDVSDFLGKHEFAELQDLVKKTPSLAESGTPKFEIIPRFGGVQIDLRPKVNAIFKLYPIRIDAARFIAEASLITDTGVIWATRKDWADDLTRRKIAAGLEERFPLGFWFTLIESAYLNLRDRLSEAQLSQEAAGVQWLCCPFIAKHGLNVIYGPMGHFKSLILEAIALSIAEGKALLPSLEVYETGRVLWLDFEGLGSNILKDRARKILGKDPENFAAYTIRMPLDSSYSSIITLIEREEPCLLIIDSLGPAVGGDLSAASSAFAFFNTISSWGLPIAIIAHPPKHSPDSIFGSAFFGNLARNIWLVEKLAQVEDTAYVTLYHEKFSFGRPEPSRSLEIIFDDAERLIKFKPWKPLLPTKAFTSGPMGMRIVNYLQTIVGPAAPKDIAKACNIPPSMINVILRQLEEIGLISRNGKEVTLAPALRRQGEDEVPF